MVRELVFKFSDALRRIGINIDDGKHQTILDMQKRIHQLNTLNFKIDIHPDGSWVAESVNVDGIITGGTSSKEMNTLIKDAIFTYFEIPPHLCNDSLLLANNESVSVEQKVWATK